MFEGFTLAMVDTGEATPQVRHGGSGPPLLLLHGHPHTRAVAPGRPAPHARLPRDFTVAVPNLRGTRAFYPHVQSVILHVQSVIVMDPV